MTIEYAREQTEPADIEPEPSGITILHLLKIVGLLEKKWSQHVDAIAAQDFKVALQKKEAIAALYDELVAGFTSISESEDFGYLQLMNYAECDIIQNEIDITGQLI